MSKAFTREDDDAPEEPVIARPNPALPPGAKNWMTADGAERLREELRMLHAQRAAAPNAEDWTRGSAQRLAELDYTLGTAEVVAPQGGACEEVCFGATVQVRENDGTRRSYRIVGLDETDLDRGWVSWLSPIARALLGARRGQRVRFSFPSGEKELEIVAISDEPPVADPNPAGA